MRIMMIVQFFVTSLLISVCLCFDKPRIKTPLGEIRGSIRTADSGRKYSAFEGIPYAKPPIGDRRFEAPEPVEPWDGVWNANFLTQCAQSPLSLNGSITGDEDCLHINVYVPRENINPDEKLEVVIHIHGGAYMYCSGHFYINPKYLMDHDVIFVTFNYRLGILGFLSTEDDVVPGNNGLKDQVLALKWVQENIASFGGNPDSVTLTGLSAGGASVHMHYLSDLSKGLFHRGFAQSGVALNSFSLQKEPLTKTKILANAVGCSTCCSKTMIKCLKQRPFHHLLAQMPLFFGYNILPLAPFGPVVEKGSKTNAFLNDNPYKLLVEGKVNDVPIIFSNTAHEGVLPMIDSEETVEQVNQEWENLAPYLLDFNYTVPKEQWKTVAQKVKEFYLGKDQKLFNEDNFFETSRIFSDRIFMVDAEDAVRLHSKVTQSPVYYYIFTYPGDNNEKNVVSHGADAKYFFDDMFTKKQLTTNELKMKDMLLEMLVSYAKTGKPALPKINWKPTKHDVLTFLNISSIKPENNQLQTVEELTPRTFWKSLGLRENENLLSSTKDEL